jgi:hypothetical protein
MASQKICTKDTEKSSRDVRKRREKLVHALVEIQEKTGARECKTSEDGFFHFTLEARTPYLQHARMGAELTRILHTLFILFKSFPKE